MCKIHFPIAVLLLLISVATHAQVRESKALNYQDCLLQATREGYVRERSDIGRIKLDCEARFPDTAPQVLGERLDSDVIEKLDIYTHGDTDGGISITVYNGNSHIILTRLQLLLTPKKDDPIQDFFDSEEFEIAVKVLPYKTQVVKIDSDETQIQGAFGWKLIRAWGY